MEKRFQRSDEVVLGQKVRNWRGDSPGGFLGVLWSLLGPPDEVADGFTYYIHDRDSGLHFRAYLGPSGPAFGTRPPYLPAIGPVLDEFEDVLDSLPLAECCVRMDGELSLYEVGVEGGQPFERTTLLDDQ